VATAPRTFARHVACQEQKGIVNALLRYGCLILLAGSLVLAGLLWLLPINGYEVHACDPDGVAVSSALLLSGLLLLAGAVAGILVDGSASRRRRRILLGLCGAVFAIHLARGPELLRERAWTSRTCDVGPTKSRP
jgi:hypothetical protein